MSGQLPRRGRSIDLRAITSVAGNGRIEHTTLNARIACTVAGIRDVPIARGAAAPLAQPLRPAEWIHGANALGGPVLPERTDPPWTSAPPWSS